MFDTLRDDDADRSAYEAFLDRLTGPYYVVVDGHELIGAGGFSARQTPRVADLSWWLVRRDRRRQGAGSLLMTTCIGDLIGDPFVDSVRVVATRADRHFFERWGFAPANTTSTDSQAVRVAMSFALDEAGKQRWSESITGGLEPPEIEKPIPVIEYYKDWTANRYQPGAYLGGNLEPHLDRTRIGPAGRRLSGLLLGIMALMTTFAFPFYLGSGWERFAWAVMTAVMWIAAVRMFLSGRKPAD